MLCKNRDIFMTRDSPGFVVFVFVVFLRVIQRTAPFPVNHLQTVVNNLHYVSLYTDKPLLQIYVEHFLAYFGAKTQCFMATFCKLSFSLYPYKCDANVFLLH